MDLKRMRGYAAHLLGRYVNLIDPDDIVQTAIVEFLSDGGGSEDLLLMNIALVAGRLKQQARRRLPRMSSLSANVSKEQDEDGLTFGDLQKAKTVDPVSYTLINEVLHEAVLICQALLEGKVDSAQKAVQMENVLKYLFVDGAESLAAAYEVDRQSCFRGPMGRTAVYELWLEIVKQLKIRLAGLPGKGGRLGERDKRRK